jgi:hypothetical protein
MPTIGAVIFGLGCVAIIGKVQCDLNFGIAHLGENNNRGLRMLTASRCDPQLGDTYTDTTLPLKLKR